MQELISRLLKENFNLKNSNIKRQNYNLKHRLKNIRKDWLRREDILDRQKIKNENLKNQNERYKEKIGRLEKELESHYKDSSKKNSFRDFLGIN